MMYMVAGRGGQIAEDTEGVVLEEHLADNRRLAHVARIGRFEVA